MSFFKYCSACKTFFQNEKDWTEHQNSHNLNKKELKKPFDEVEKKADLEAKLQPTGGDFDAENDLRIQKTKKLTAMKKELKKQGIECATMKEDEVIALYEKMKKDEEKKDA
jgi:uncharacterized C2H2 Zn-finger protein